MPIVCREVVREEDTFESPARDDARKRGETVVYVVAAKGLYAYLTKQGHLFARLQPSEGPFKQFDWFKQVGGRKRPWVPPKRKSFVSLFKLAARDGDFDDLLQGGD